MCLTVQQYKSNEKKKKSKHKTGEEADNKKQRGQASENNSIGDYANLATSQSGTEFGEGLGASWTA
jgi:hypothetical protein